MLEELYGLENTNILLHLVKNQAKKNKNKTRTNQIKRNQQEKQTTNPPKTANQQTKKVLFHLQENRI